MALCGCVMRSLRLFRRSRVVPTVAPFAGKYNPVVRLSVCLVPVGRTPSPDETVGDVEDAAADGEESDKAQNAPIVARVLARGPFPDGDPVVFGVEVRFEPPYVPYGDFAYFPDAVPVPPRQGVEAVDGVGGVLPSLDALALDEVPAEDREQIKDIFFYLIDLHGMRATDRWFEGGTASLLKEGEAPLAGRGRDAALLSERLFERLGLEDGA